jgi:hypothetical protein
MNQSKGAPPAALVVSRLRCVFPGLHLVRTVVTELGHATKARSRGSRVVWEEPFVTPQPRANRFSPPPLRFVRNAG